MRPQGTVDPSPPETLWLEGVGGVALAVDYWPGERQPILAVHGLASNARLWWAVASTLAEAGHAVAALDQRGHGRSDKPSWGYDFATIVDDLGSVIAQLASAKGDLWSNPLLAGQSWGGNVVLEAAARRAGHPSAIACVDGGTIELRDSFTTWEECRTKLAPPSLAGMRASRLEGIIRSAHPTWPEEGIRATLANVEVRSGGTIAPWLGRENHLKILQALWDHQPSKLYAGIEVPVLLIPADNREENASAKRAAIDQAEAAIPRCRVRWVEGDHDLHAQHPTVIAELLHAATQEDFFP